MDNKDLGRPCGQPALVADATGAASVSAHSGDGQAQCDQTGWLIEKDGDDGAPVWLETCPEIDGWTKDSGSALRFARQIDAGTFVDYYLGEPSNFQLRVTEHIWAEKRA